MSKRKIVEWARAGYTSTLYIVRMTAPPLLGGLLGYMADQKLGSNPIILICGILMGLIFAVYHTYKKVKDMYD